MSESWACRRADYLAGVAVSPSTPSAAERARDQVLAFGEWPTGVIRLGVVICVILGALIVPGALSDALDGNDFWADRNGSLDYVAREVPPAEAVGSQKVAEDARLWMPEDAAYRIVQAPDLSGPLQWAAPDFLATFLLPRRETEAADAEWVFCYGCDLAELGEGFEVLSDSGEGILFGRVNP